MKNSRYLLILLMLNVLTACTSDQSGEPALPEADYVRFDDTASSPVAPAEGGAVTIRFSTNCEWQLSIPVESEVANGVVEQRAGEPGVRSIVYTARPNVTGTARSTTFRIAAGRATGEITVTQPSMEVTITPEEEIRGYLMRLYEATDGPNWRFRGKWGSDLPISQWGSEVRYENGLLYLNLNEHYLKGEIDLSGCTALRELRCSKNQVTRIDVSGCTMLDKIDCTNNKISDLNLTACRSLTHLSAGYNNLAGIDVGWMTTIDWLYVNNNSLTRLDLRDCVSLKTLACNDNQLRELVIPHRSELSSVYCYANELTELDFSDSPWLQLINCGDNELTRLDISACPKLWRIYCYENRLTSLDLSDKKEVLTELYCFTNRLGSLDVSGCRMPLTVHCSDNELTQLDVTGCRYLSALYCSYNQLEELDFDGIDRDALSALDCSYNRLRRADLTDLKLNKLWCQGNRIGGEIPEAFDRMQVFEHDARYEYRPATGSYTDRGYGWYYPGEPAKMSHTR